MRNITGLTYIVFTTTPEGADGFEIVGSFKALADRLADKTANQVLDVQRIEPLIDTEREMLKLDELCRAGEGAR